VNALSDEELVERYRGAVASQRNAAFLDQLFQRNHPRVAAWCLRMTGDAETAADLAQEVFLKAFQRIDSFRGDSRFTTWLYAIARNHCMDELRSRATRAEERMGPAMDEVPDLRYEDISTTMERREATEMMQLLMRETLDETETRVMTMHYVHELPLESVTRVLGLRNQSGAKQYVVSARRKLARAFARWNSRKQAVKGAGDAE
jgi:RNA polymerase sigma-70 factor, ECF subfamily